MKKSIKFTLITTWILLSRGYDAYCTYQYTPDLSHEANPLVAVLNFSWTPLLTVVFGLTILVIYAYHKSIFQPFNLHPKEGNFCFNHFVGYVYSGKKQGALAMLYSLPNSLKRFIHYSGHVITICLSFAGIVSTVMWIGLNYIPEYKPLHSAKLIYGIITIGIVFILYWWNKKEYRLYQLKHAIDKRN